jgi:hypothetical protein
VFTLGVGGAVTAAGGLTGVDGVMLEILIENDPQASLSKTVPKPGPMLYESKP